MGLLRRRDVGVLGLPQWVAGGQVGEEEGDREDEEEEEERGGEAPEEEAGHAGSYRPGSTHQSWRLNSEKSALGLAPCTRRLIAFSRCDSQR